jgi:hopanoid biosynthesis associated RND transporter like protein HpnN
LLAISILSLLIGLIGTAAFAAAAVGHLNLLSVAFAVLYVGLGVDFIVHISLRLEELMADGQDVELGLINTMHGVGASLVICAITTAVGFYSFIPTPFSGVSELGLISGTGMFISLFVSLTLVPALIAELYSPKGAPPRVRGLGSLRRSVLGVSPRFTLAAACLVLVAAALSLPRVSFDSNPVHLRDPDSESVQALEELAAQSDAEMLSLVAIAPNETTADEWKSRLAGVDSVAEVRTIDSLVPEAQDEKRLVLEDTGLVMGDLGRFDVEASDPGEFLAALTRLNAALLERPDKSTAEAALADGTARALARLASQQAAPEELAALDRDLIGNLPDELGQLAHALTARPFDRTALPPELTERWLDGAGRDLIEIVPAENVNDNAAAERFVDGVRAVLPHATGLPVVHLEASRTVVESFQLALFYAFVLVSLILAVLLRSARDTAMVLAPIVFAAVVTAGATVWLGIPFNFANIIALPLLVGVGVDNGIHMVHRMRTEPPSDGEPLSTSTSRAVLASGLTTVASFGNLAFSAHVGMSSMGKLLTLGMGVTLVATLILLPALFRVRLAR